MQHKFHRHTLLFFNVVVTKNAHRKRELKSRVCWVAVSSHITLNTTSKFKLTVHFRIAEMVLKYTPDAWWHFPAPICFRSKHSKENKKPKLNFTNSPYIPSICLKIVQKQIRVFKHCKMIVLQD